MARERDFQRKLIQFFEDELGYEEKNSETAFQGLIIKSDLLRFFNSSRNAAIFDDIVSNEFGGDEQKAIDEISELIIYEHFSKPDHLLVNSATFLQQKTLKFKGRDLWLFYPSPSPGTESRFDENIFSIAEELVYKPQIDYRFNMVSRRPDLVFYVNGIYFSLLELKHIFQGSNTNAGVVKIIANYNDYVRGYYPEIIKKPEHTEDEIRERNRVLSLYEKAVHVVSMDHATLSMMRNIRDYRRLCQEEGAVGSAYLEKDMKRTFFPYPLRHEQDKGTDDHGLVSRYEDVLRDVYGKEAIQNEILFFNYREKVEGDKKRPLISPRPKQKYGCDRTIERVKWLYEHESNPDFIRNEYAARLRRLGVPEAKVSEEVETRMKLVNDTGCYSILKQYAAGFGKTKLMSWEAVELAHMHTPNAKNYLFDKIVLVSDRLDLRDQMGQTLGAMPILEKGAWDIASDTQEFMKALRTDACRIIAVNIQKFLSLERHLSKGDKAMLASMRVAFLIDEIHRSNDGKQNDNMMDLFEGLSTANAAKKNLIIGLTATAKDKTLQRYGEISGYTSGGMVFQPFDCFTMQEAIDAGFVLNPMTAFFPVHQPIIIDSEIVDEDRIGLDYRKPTSDDFYTDKTKIKGVVKKSMEYLRAVTFTRIRKPGEGSIAKAMYVGHSIDAAILAFHLFKNELDNLYGEADNRPGLYIVFSKPTGNDQRSRQSAKELNNGLSEVAAIKQFKADKNAIIIVVDKLQTGFDEPTLHTLILNTERKDVTMVQTLCRVNRTHKYKKECLVLDFSIICQDGLKTRNEVNAEEAFKKYAGMNTSALNLAIEEGTIGKNFKKLQSHYVYDRLFDDFFRGCKNIDDDFKFVDKLNTTDPSSIRDYFDIAKEMFGAIKKLRGIVHLDKKLIRDIESSKLELFLKSIRRILKSGQKDIPSLPFEVLDISGVTIEDVEALMDSESKGPRSGPVKGKKDKDKSGEAKHSLIDAIRKHNEMNEYSEEMILEFADIIANLLQALYESSLSRQMNNNIKDNPYGDHIDLFKSNLESVFRRYKGPNGPIKSKYGKERGKEYTNKLSSMMEVFIGKFYQDYLYLLGV